MWILTRSVNDYNQDGEYFVAAFSEKPDMKQLSDCGVCNQLLPWVWETGGGRKPGTFDNSWGLCYAEWFTLRQMKDGEMIP